MDTQDQRKAQQQIKVLPGLNGCLELFADRVVYHPIGLLSKLTRWPEYEVVEIGVKNLCGVEFHEDVFLTNGYLKLTAEDGITVVLVFEQKLYDTALEMRNLLLQSMGHRYVMNYQQRLTP